MAPAGLRSLWRSRPAIHSRRVWALLLALDRLPWPIGEDLLAHMFTAVSLASPRRRASVRAWAARQGGAASPARLARAACAFRGRWVARSALLGVRTPEALLRHVRIRGDEHLAATGGGAILLGVHLGPPNTDIALRIAGHRLAWVGSRRTSAAWSRPPWSALLDPKDSLFRPAEERFWPGVLYRARRLLLDGGTVFMMADSWQGRELFRIALPGGDITIRGGWLSLHRHAGVPVWPVLTHLDGRTQVITIHSPLPKAEHDEGSDGGPWRAALDALVREHAARFPEQCPALIFPARLPVRPTPTP